MSRTISGTYANGVDLTNSADNPVTISSAGSIGSTAGGIGLYGQAYIDWTINNSGLITATGTNSRGIVLNAGGTVNNTGSISGSARGVYIERVAGAVTNSGAGTISGTGTYDLTGTNGIGVDLGDGGSVGNTGGLITGVVYGVKIRRAAGTVSNSGTGVISGTGPDGRGIWLASGGSIGNTDGRITGVFNGIRITGAAGTVVNAGTGTISGTGPRGQGAYLGRGEGIYLGSGGSVSNTEGLITGNYIGVEIRRTGAVTNSAAGTISGSDYGIVLDYGAVDNSNGVITSEGIAVNIRSIGGTVTNSGATISSTGTYGIGVALRLGGAIANTNGLITGAHFGVYLSSPGILTGTVTNSDKGTIAGTGAAGIGLFAGNGGGVVNNSGLIAGVLGGVEFVEVAGTVSNSGVGTLSAAGTSGVGVSFGMGGSVSNADGLITGVAGGIRITRAAGTVTNAGSGTVSSTGTAGVGIFFGNGGKVGNTNGLISGTAYGVQITENYGFIFPGALAAVTNYTGGTIAGGIDGVFVSGSAGTIINFGSSVISGSTQNGVYLVSGGTVSNAGRIFGGADGVHVIGTAGTVMNSGYISGLTGVIFGAANSTLITSGTIVGIGGTAFDFGTSSGQGLVIHNGAVFTGSLADFGPRDGIDLADIGTDGQVTHTDAVNHLVTVTGSLGSVTLQFSPGTPLDLVTASDGANGTELVTCFCRNTLIRTEKGEVPVEDLAIGDRVITLSGEAKPIVWIGMGSDLVTRRHSLARPIIVRQGALADGVPSRDLYLTHGHKLYLNGVLIAVEHLANGRSILWDDSAELVEYYHIELEDHDVVWANGAPSETYYDDGNRSLFQNRRPGYIAGEAKPNFAPIVTGGGIVEETWAALYTRAGGVVTKVATTEDPDLHLSVNGQRSDPISSRDGLYVFTFHGAPAGPIELRSRFAVPSLVGMARSDHRQLGVAIRQIIISGRGGMLSLDAEAPVLLEGGCYSPEQGFCWTDGVLYLPRGLFAAFRGPVRLLIHTSNQGMRYAVAKPTSMAA